jgi:hypothetical protein
VTRQFSKHCRNGDPQAVTLSVDSRKAVSLRVLLLVTWKGLLLFAKGHFGTVDTSNKFNKSQ